MKALLLATLVFVTEHRSQAQVKVYVTEHEPAKAVWLAPRASAAKGACQWFITPHRSRATLVVWFTKNRSEADLVIRWAPRCVAP